MLRWAVLCACLLMVQGQLSTEMDSLLNWCLDARHHKTRPGREDELHHQCEPWREHACCTTETTRRIHTTDHYGFTYDHCPGRKMSDKCRRHFIRDLCFYECSPNIGPWVTKTNMKIRNERFYKVPLCASACIDWYEDCKDDYTCTDNWTRNFRWRNGTNHCPDGAPCYTIREVYSTASNFCQTIWDDSWAYTEDSQPCMQVWFQPGGGNPNAEVARLRAAQLTGAAPSGAPVPAVAPPLLLLLLLVIAGLM